MKGITFIGMAGSGKSAVGRTLAAMVNWKFVDLDKLILETQKISHHDYMEKNGEAALSALEEKLTLGLNLQNTIFAPPGSMIYSPKAMQKIKKDSIVVCLQASPEIIAERLGDNLYKNGIIGLKEKGLAGVMAERAVLYQKYADYTFVSKRQSREAMAKKVLKGLKAEGINI